ncbi:MAG: hypothetical protein V3T61_11935, partial [Acidobacteriota bacterium]
FGLGAGAPLVAEYADHPIGRELGGVMTFFPFAQNVTTSESSLGYQTTGLLKSSENSWAESDLRGGRAAFDQGQDLKGPLDLAAAATRSVDEESEDQQEDPQAGDGEEQQEKPEPPAGESRLVLFGDSDFASNGYFGAGANGDLFLMTVSWLAEETDLIAIRPKSPEDRRIETTLTQSRLIFWGSVVLLPAITLVLGVVVWYRRK